MGMNEWVDMISKTQIKSHHVSEPRGGSCDKDYQPRQANNYNKLRSLFITPFQKARNVSDKQRTID